MKSVHKIKTRYYSKEVLKYLLMAGALAITGAAPYEIWKAIFGGKTSPRRRATDCFRSLQKQGLIDMRRDGHDLHIALTKKGKKRAGKYQINDLQLKRPKQWDKKWRVVIFDIPSTSNIIRNVFRAKLKEFGFYPLQKSIWAYPFPCEEEIAFLRDFLGADKKEIQVLEVSKMENDRFLRKIFKL